MNVHRTRARVLAAAALSLALVAPVAAQARGGEGALSAIRESDIKADLFTLAGDAMRGREAGTLDELRASMWLAERARAAGLQPAGDDGTYFQFWNMRRFRQGGASTVLLDGQPLALWHEVALSGVADTTVEGPVVWVGTASEQELATIDLQGKIAAAEITPPPTGTNPNVSLAGRRYATAAVNRIGMLLRNRGAAAVILVADSLADSAFDVVSANSMRGQYAVDNGQVSRAQSRAPLLWVRANLKDRLRAAQKLQLHLTTESFLYPSVNVVAKVPGTDAGLRGQYVLFSAHQDHDGVRAPIDGDSIFNGADDNASVAVGVLAIGRAFAQKPGRRSALFVWHGAEERGLLGSRYHAAHPVVPKDSIVAVINADMIGRNHPDTASLMGVTPPHLSSSDLVKMALEANDRVSKFVIDSTWDRTTHPEGWYFRSDHLPYAQANIPSVYFSSLLHADYHTPRDEPSRIDTAKLTRIAKWMFATGWTVANTDARPRLEPGFKLER